MKQKKKDAISVRFKRFIIRRKAKRKYNKCWKAADILIALGQENKKAQKHINFSKDELYNAIQIFLKIYKGV